MHFELERKKHIFGQTSYILGAPILEFCVASVFFLKSGIWRVYVPNFMLVSPSEDFDTHHVHVSKTQNADRTF